MKRKHSPAHDFWHRRVEGQIRHTIGQHPEWFCFASEHQKQTAVNSLAKRIVGEIVAAAMLAPISDRVPVTCPVRGESEADCRLASPEPVRAVKVRTGSDAPNGRSV